jgi:Flp pilus assembly protein TadG
MLPIEGFLRYSDRNAAFLCPIYLRHDLTYINNAERMAFSKRIVKRFIKRDDGATAIEFAIIAPILFLLIMGILEFGLIYYAKSVIENAVAYAARLGITNNQYTGNVRVAQSATSPTDRVAMIKENILARSDGLLKPDKISISCSSAGQTFGNLTNSTTGNYGCGSAINNTASCATAGGRNEAVIYTARYCWDLFTPMIGNFFPGGQVVLQSSLVVKNENF